MPSNPPSSSSLYIGLMSGTSMDGVDGVLVEFADDFPQTPCRSLAHVSLGFDAGLRAQLQSLQAASENEIEREALAANQLVARYAEVVQSLLQKAGVPASSVRAIGAHGQTVRHRPELGFTRQINNPALLAELTGIDVIADFRSRDIAAGGQGAPLVPAFHHAIFGRRDESRVVLNQGGIANISILQAAEQNAGQDSLQVTGFDTGPGNVLLDLWIKQQLGLDYDENGAWGASGTVHLALLQQMLQEPYFALAAPKSTGRDLFNAAWLAQQLAQQLAPWQIPAPDVQATLLALTAQTCAQAILRYVPQPCSLYVCGGGAHNLALMRALQNALPDWVVASTAVLGVPVQEVEALAFAWLAQRYCLRLAGNLPAVTGARGLRILGACYPGNFA